MSTNFDSSKRKAMMYHSIDIDKKQHSINQQATADISLMSTSQAVPKLDFSISGQKGTIGRRFRQMTLQQGDNLSANVKPIRSHLNADRDNS